MCLLVRFIDSHLNSISHILIPTVNEMKLLHIDASILGDNSVSRRVSDAVVARLRAAIPNLEVTYRDLTTAPLSHLSGANVASRSANMEHDQALQEELSLGSRVLEEFLAADIVVIGAPMYNFTVPSQLKAWVDRILVAGKTFQYGPTGAEGLAKGKRVILAISRGGFYGAGTPNAAAEHMETYLRTVFGFIGIPAPEIIVAEGIAVGPDQRQKAIEGALQAVANLRAA
jgi:FMN-dependent NADH-azoreductase